MRRWAFACIILFTTIRCGSLLGELERIRNKALAAPAGGSAPPVVLYTIPADGATSAPLQTYIDVVFDQPIDAATVAGPVNGSCTGTAQASTDNFEGCGGNPAATGNTVRITANGGAMPQGGIIKVQTTSGVKGTNGVAAVPYTSPVGISFTSPCGQNCFYSDSAPLTTNNGSGGHAFVIPSGAKAGWILTVNGGGTATTLWNPQTNQTQVGPTLCNSASGGSHSFEVKTLGGPRSGKVITFMGGGGTSACTFDNGSETFSAGPLLGGANPNTGAMTIPVLTGGNAGKYLLVVGNGTLAYLYDVGLDSFGVTPSVGGNPSVGAHWFRYDAGPQAGNPVIIAGNGFGNTRYYSEAGNSFGTLYTSTITNGAGSLSFKVNAGPLAGRFLIMHGAGATNSTGYDQNNGEVAGPSTCAVGAGSQWAMLSSGPRSGQTVILCGGGGLSGSSYMFYEHGTNSISTLTSLTGSIAGDSSMTQITTGQHVGKYLIMNGSLTRNTSMFDPAQDAFVGTRMFRTPGLGSHGFVIKSGPKAGRVLLYAGGATLGTTLYNPQTGLTELGPDLAATVNSGSHPIVITSGTNSGFTYIFTGGGSTGVQKYNPVTNSFATASAGPDFTSLPAGKGTGSRSIIIGSGPQANNYLILNGGGTGTADYFITSTNTFASAGTIVGCASVSAGSQVFQIQFGVHAGKYMILCGSSVNTSIYDPATPAFSAGPSLISGTPGTGAHGFNIPSGPDAGKYLMFPGTGNNTRLYDPGTNTWGAGPLTTPCPGGGIQGAGGFAMYIDAGVHTGKILVVLGGDSTNTCYFNPQNSTFSAGPATGPHAGYAVGAESFSFRYGKGLYPGAHFIVHGGASTVISHWFAY